MAECLPLCSKTVRPTNNGEIERCLPGAKFVLYLSGVTATVVLRGGRDGQSGGGLCALYEDTILVRLNL